MRRAGRGGERDSADPLIERFVPEFCLLRTAFTLVLLSEFLALLLALASAPAAAEFWTDLGLYSLFTIWVAVGSAGLLCILDRKLGGLAPIEGAWALMLVIQLMTLLAGWAGLRLLAGAEVLSGTGLFEGVPFRLMRNGAIAGLVSAVWVRYLYVQFERRLQVRAESEARFDALQARMRPHFLFNGLNTIASLVVSDPAKAVDLLLDLAELFRAILKQDHRLTTLEDELHLVRQYLGIETQRLGGRLKVVWNLDAAPLDARLPPLSLQPLVENAIYHGVESLAEGGTVEIHGQLRKDELLLTVRNPAPAPGASHRKGNQEALENLRLRLQRCFPERGQLMTSIVDDVYQSRIVIPYDRRTHEDSPRR